MLSLQPGVQVRHHRERLFVSPQAHVPSLELGENREALPGGAVGRFAKAFFAGYPRGRPPEDREKDKELFRTEILGLWKAVPRFPESYRKRSKAESLQSQFLVMGDACKECQLLTWIENHSRAAGLHRTGERSGGARRRSPSPPYSGDGRPRNST